MTFFGKPPQKQDQHNREQNALLKMIEETQAVIYFEPDGTITNANQNFQSALGYDLTEIKGQKHAMFVDPEYRQSSEYKEFWEDLREGKSFSDQFPRRRKDGSTIWIQATYSPVRNDNGDITRVIKIASDVTARRTGVGSISKGLHRLRDGDLTYRVAPCDVPDLDSVIEAFNEACDQLQFLVSQVKSGNATISQSSSLMHQSSEQLSERTETQAATLEETAAAIEALTTHATSAADKASNVDDIASNTRAAAQDSGQVVKDVTDAMGRIEKSSGEISQIITVIDDLAFQTNLLSLNAGVEAARAGEAGRGFAVVATEVRALAQQSANSARDIKQLINQSSEHVAEGAELVQQASRELNNIFEGVGTISSHIKDISSGLNQQSSTLAQINTAIADLDHVTQSNASMVLETTEISKSLQKDSASLSDQVASFNTTHSDATAWDTTKGKVQRAS
ncbi:PAS domain-containing methyl-accepting chemotaxis protein [uncultured Pelagimonas sp.]|uniref:methyl-accepting chemotaxis protein n=1 Tax=uncultured Pelagimonas sp. TaxID=1618102 RepID=UPI00262B422B|nr:PAS domain-containing methyl-accepting chemotaxis protein [uncultured Pelagimonas sp.]